MAVIDEIEELRAKLRDCLLSAKERRDAEDQLAGLVRRRTDRNHADIPTDTSIAIVSLRDE